MSRKLVALGSALAACLSLLAVLAGPANAAETTGRGLLAKLTVASEAGTTQYSTARFKPWGDLDGDCQSTRQEVFIQDSSWFQLENLSLCRVGRGIWPSAYYGGEYSSWAQYLAVDHRVALKEAWESGAYWWSPATRERFANDLDYTHTLVVTSKGTDLEKGDSDPAEWLPSDHPYRQCNYALAWIQVKYRWNLTVDPTEKTALLEVLDGACRTRTVVIPPRAF